MRVLIITSVQAEARALGDLDNAAIIISGVGRTNAAAATTEAILRQCSRGPGFDAVLNLGIAGALPGSNLHPGDVLCASACIYTEEGLLGPHGFVGMHALGFPLGDFEGNAVPVDPDLLDRLASRFAIGPIATVATCSGTDAAAAEVARRTGALAEAMEGAAVIHAARRLKVPAIELRTISNTTGDRPRQHWNLDLALTTLHTTATTALTLLNDTPRG